MMEDGLGTATAEPTPTAEPQIAPQPTAEPQPAALADDQYVRVQKDQIKDFPGGWHETVAAGRSWQQLQASGGMESIERNNRLLAAYRAQPGNETKTAQEMEEFLMAVDAPAPLPDDPDQQPMTRANMKEFFAEQRKEQEENYAQETLRQGRDREVQTMGQKLEEIGIKKDNPHYGAFQSVLAQNIDAEIRKGFLPIHNQEQRDAMLSAPASPEVIAAAADATKAFLTDFANQSAGAIANQQATIPGGTLGAQPPGGQGAIKLSVLQSKAASGDAGAIQMLQDWGNGKIGDDQVTRD